MDGFGDRLRQRARELGLSDTEVARRVGLTQSRYANYVSDRREPDFATFVRICRVLGTTPDLLLGFGAIADAPSADERLRQKITASAMSMNADGLRTLAEVAAALAATRGGG